MLCHPSPTAPAVTAQNEGGGRREEETCEGSTVGSEQSLARREVTRRGARRLGSRLCWTGEMMRKTNTKGN